jgi:hypothetical protein
MSCACGGGGCGTCGGRLPLADRLQPRVDKLRQRFTTFGLRPYSVLLVWTRWGGSERGEGHEITLFEAPIIPRPKVVDLTSVALNAYSAGLLPVGSVSLEEVTTQLSEEHLTGRVVPPRSYLDGCGAPRYNQAFPGMPPDVMGRTAAEQIGAGSPAVRDRIEEPYDFFYEIVLDTRAGQPPALRRRFRLAATPFKNPGKFGWSIVLERQSEDRNREGRSQVGIDDDA